LHARLAQLDAKCTTANDRANRATEQAKGLAEHSRQLSKKMTLLTEERTNEEHYPQICRVYQMVLPRYQTRTDHNPRTEANALEKVDPWAGGARGTISWARPW
jgi:hypothetical protein